MLFLPFSRRPSVGNQPGLSGQNCPPHTDNSDQIRVQLTSFRVQRVRIMVNHPPTISMKACASTVCVVIFAPEKRHG